MFSITLQNPDLPAEHLYLIIGAEEEVWPVIHIEEQNRMTQRTPGAKPETHFCHTNLVPKADTP